MNIQRAHPVEYAAWLSAKTRCYNPKYHNFRHYGGRGIYMSDEWRENFKQFYADLGSRPPGHSLDRIENDGPYSPQNCRWAKPREQHQNTRTNRKLSLNGIALPAAEWARRLGFPNSTLHSRLAMGWSVERALTTPARRHNNA